MKILLFAFIVITALSIIACSQDNKEKTSTSAATTVEKRDVEAFKKKPFHTDIKTVDSAASTTPVANAVKKNYLEVSSTKTIGEAFDSYTYAIEKEWREAPSRSGPYFVDYICWFHVSPISADAVKKGIVKQGLDIKFAVHDDGETYIAMASRIDITTDGMVRSTPLEPPEIKKIVISIYNNREITF